MLVAASSSQHDAGSSDEATITPGQHRVKHSKRRTGCGTCKRSRQKCDEVKPGCLRCLQANRVCDGYTKPVPRQRNTRAAPFRGFRYVTPMAQIQSSPSETQEEKRSLHYFQHCTFKLLQSQYPDTWPKNLLAAQHNHITLRRCCIALGALHASLTAENTYSYRHGSSSYNFSLQQHTAALGSLRKDIASAASPEVVQLACVAFLLYESMSGRRQEYEIHLRHGLELAHSAPSSSTDLQEIRGLLYVVNSLRLLHDRPRTNTKVTSLDLVQTVSESFTTPSDLISARTSLAEIVTAVLLFNIRIERQEFPDVLSQTYAQHKLRVIMQQWWTAVDNMAKDDFGPAQTGIKLLRVQYLIAYVYLDARPHNTQVAFDRHLSRYEAVVELVESIARDTFVNGLSPPILSLGLGLIATLFLLILTCRHPLVRRKAIQLLSVVPQREGSWDASMIACAAKSIIEQEEARACQSGLELCEDANRNFGIPEECRIKEVNIVDDDTSIYSEQFKKIIMLEWVYLDQNDVPGQTRIGI